MGKLELGQLPGVNPEGPAPLQAGPEELQLAEGRTKGHRP